MIRYMFAFRYALGSTVGICSLACGRSDKSRTPIRDSTPVSIAATSAPIDTTTGVPKGFVCFSSDSGNLVFGEIQVSAEDGDAAGVSLSFQVTPLGLIGSVVDAQGETPPPRRLQGLHYDSTSDSLGFWYASSTNTRYVYSLRPSCDSLWGVARLFVTDNSPGQRVKETFRRNR
jgi:hypothetical protein